MNIRVTGAGVVAAIIAVVVALWLLRKLRAGDVALDRALIGKTGDITRPIDPRGPGTIRIEGHEYLARSTERIEAGAFGEVVAIDGAAVTVVQVPALSSHTTGYHMMEM